MVTAIGVDLAWQGGKNASGLALACGDSNGAEVVELRTETGMDAIVATIQDWSRLDETVVVAIDAPLIIRNETGQRPCEREISKRFGRKHGGAHSTNRSKYPNATSVRLVTELEGIGFRHSPEDLFRRTGRWIFEVYPHPAMINLFELDRVLAYKAKRKRSRETRDEAFRFLLDAMGGLASASPSLAPGAEGTAMISSDTSQLRGAALKAFEDKLDAWFCAYLALHAHAHGSERHEVVGDFQTGYIVLPTLSHR